ncbi:T9SS type A sorting domain-containing protein, partial [uncultured Algoriphagus sp.]
NKPGTARLVNAMGQILVDEIAIPANREVGIQAQALQPGVYFLQLETLDREVLVKKILIR